MRVEIADTITERLRGLLGRRGFTDALLLTPCNDVHTFGMRQPIDVAFIASDGHVLESFRSVRPRKRIRCTSATSTLERFAVDTPWLKTGDRISLKEIVKDNIGPERGYSEGEYADCDLTEGGESAYDNAFPEYWFIQDDKSPNGNANQDVALLDENIERDCTSTYEEEE